MRGTTAAVFLLGGSLVAGAQAATEGPETERKEAYRVRYLIFLHQGYWDNPLDAEGEPQSANANADGPMGPVWEKLSESSRYRPLVRDLQVPFAGPRDEAEPIAVSASWPASIRPPFAAMEGVADRPMRLALEASWAPEETGDRAFQDRLRGTLTFSKGRYAHLDVNLVFREAQRWMPWGVDVRHYFMQQSRRILPNRFYYFDHPRFGVLAHIKPMGE